MCIPSTVPKGDAGQSSERVSSKRADIQGSVSVREDDYTKLSLSESLTALLVLVQSCLSKEEWTELLSPLWFSLDGDVNEVGSVSFHSLKCSLLIIARIPTNEVW